jgi:arginine/ornithine N-succinyltransferase beta subunit
MGFQCLVARPAREDEAEIHDLLAAAEIVNLGNTRGETVRELVTISEETLRGMIPWDQGLLYLATEYHGDDAAVPAIVGSCKLQCTVGACWVRKRHIRVSHRRLAERRYRSEYDLLVYDATRADGLEMAGNVVLPEYRSQGIGTFHTQARLLFALIHTIEPIDHLYADLLTPDTHGVYPFYEHVVKPLLDNMSYEDADRLRYEDISLLNELLGANNVAHEPACQFPIHLLPEEISSQFGTIREITKRAQNALERYNFRKIDTFDFLDGGQYFSLSLEDLHRIPTARDLRARPRATVPDGAVFLTLAPTKRSMKDFCCVRVQGTIEGLEVFLDAGVCRRVDIHDGENVKVLLD